MDDIQHTVPLSPYVNSIIQLFFMLMQDVHYQVSVDSCFLFGRLVEKLGGCIKSPDISTVVERMIQVSRYILEAIYDIIPLLSLTNSKVVGRAETADKTSCVICHE